jgi:membrane-bound serine protease (ClpP class)
VPAGTESAGTIGETVYVVRAERTVDPALEQFLKRAYREAEDARASRVLLIVNTLGGRVDSAEEIGRLIRSSKVPTTVFVQGKAVSAGTYIALNARQIVMEPGSTIGAAAVVDGSGALVDNPKVIAYWTERMKEAARLNGRSLDVAAKMVNPNMVLELNGLGRTYKEGEILALSATDAVKVGYADFTASSVDEVLERLAFKQPNVVEVNTSTIERVGQFLTDPVVRTVLLILGIAGIAIELIVPGFGIPGIVGIAAFGLYFFGHYVIGFAGMEDVFLFIIGLVLLASELFIPSFGILGALGTAALIAGVVLAAPDPKSALYSLIIALLAAGVIVFIVARRFRQRGIWNKFILRDSLTAEEGYVASADKSPLLGMRGTSLTPLRPAGMARIGGERIDVVTAGEFVPSGTPVEVVKVEGTRVVVRPCSEQTKH